MDEKRNATVEVYSYLKSISRVKNVKNCRVPIVWTEEEHERDHVLFLIRQTYFQFIDTDTQSNNYANDKNH